jgi:hypothetical protein
VRGVLSSREGSFDQIFIVESCPRELTNRFLQHIYGVQRSRRADLLTCYVDAPAEFDPARGKILSVHEPEIAQNRRRFIAGLNTSPYTLVVVFCAGSPVLQKWKWAITLCTRAKVLIVNEDGDFFFLDWANRRQAYRLFLQRISGRRGRVNFRTWTEALLVPFTLAFLISYAAVAEIRRLARKS